MEVWQVYECLNHKASTNIDTWCLTLEDYHRPTPQSKSLVTRNLRYTARQLASQVCPVLPARYWDPSKAAGYHFPRCLETGFGWENISSENYMLDHDIYLQALVDCQCTGRYRSFRGARKSNVPLDVCSHNIVSVQSLIQTIKPLATSPDKGTQVKTLT